MLIIHDDFHYTTNQQEIKQNLTSEGKLGMVKVWEEKKLSLVKFDRVCFNKVMDFDETRKNKVGEQLTRRVAQALKDNELSLEELPTVSSYILDNIDNIKNHSQLIELLTKLSQQWPLFSHILTLEKGEKIEEKEKEKSKEVTKLIKENKIEEAIKTAENVTKETKKEKG